MKKITTSEFIERAKDVHGDRYDYSRAEYTGQTRGVVIICREHGEFMQSGGNHLAGKGCAKCGREVTGQARALSQDEFVSRVKKQVGDALDLSQAEYKGWGARVKCICPEHGEFMALPAVLLRGKGNGCRKCAALAKGPERLTVEQFVERARKVHGERYDYSRVAYTTYLKDVEIICPDHGSFFQSPCNHIYGKGCPKCSGQQSRPELELAGFIRENYREELVERARKVIAPLELDLWLPGAKVGIEFNGLYWHSADREGDLTFKTKHQAKASRCLDAGLRLIQIREDKYAARPEVCKSIIANALGMECVRRLHARQTLVRDVTPAESRVFFDENHIDGAGIASTHLGLELDGELVSVMTFGKPRFSTRHDFELVRFANKRFTRVVGAASRLLTAFRRKNAGSIISYCNLEHGTGAVYRAIGMTEVGVTPPGYVWVKNGQKAYSRYQTQKHKLAALLKSFDPTLSESENMFNNGFRRYWDSGNLVFEIE